jgi:CheY-like chemotaxis protein/anti-sigma regulatory factor (Ser/Thr protein kinase)
MIRDVTDMMAQRARAHGLQLSLEQSSHFPPYIVGDEARLRQIVNNLLSNAVKYTQRGSVTLRLSTKQEKGYKLLIEVKDTGVGIPVEEQQQVFKPFVQLGKHGINKGTGLGLSITHQFVQMMGGSINLESEPGKGSLFSVELPLIEAKESDISKLKQADKSNVSKLAPEQPEYRILIVEDQLDNQLLLCQLHESVGFRVKLAENGAQAIQLFKDWHPHFIWMDLRMPIMDGMEATLRIRELPDGKEVKIVAVTASVLSEERSKIIAVGMDDYVRKPYRASDVYDCLARHLGVKYLFEEALETQEQVQDVILTPEMLSGLPEAYREELVKALESLEHERIVTVIQRVVTHDLALQKKLIDLARNFDYAIILQALQKNE